MFLFRLCYSWLHFSCAYSVSAQKCPLKKKKIHVSIITVGWLSFLHHYPILFHVYLVNSYSFLYLICNSPSFTSFTIFNSINVHSRLWFTNRSCIGCVLLIHTPPVRVRVPISTQLSKSVHLTIKYAPPAVPGCLLRIFIALKWSPRLELNPLSTGRHTCELPKLGDQRSQHDSWI